MKNSEESLFLKLNSMIDSEFEKDDEIDCSLISECVDFLLRLRVNESYRIARMTYNVRKKQILASIPKKKKKGKVFKIILAAAIITSFVVGTATANSNGKYTIKDLGSDSELHFDLIKKPLDAPITFGYVPKGYELIEITEEKYLSERLYGKNNRSLFLIKESVNKKHYIWINTEFKNITIQKINNIEYNFYGEEEHGKGVFWVYNGYLYRVLGTLSDEELLKIAQDIV